MSFQLILFMNKVRNSWIFTFAPFTRLQFVVLMFRLSQIGFIGYVMVKRYFYLLCV